jgi:bifunctional UDP-N-acetylglucosamine pyrophosphorylase/glucosamine-1-phosphate N-acetyltransferase
MFFTDTGKVFQTQVYEIPEGTRVARGRGLLNFLELSNDEKVLSLVPMPARIATRSVASGEKQDKFLVMMGDDLYSSNDIKEIMKYDRAILATEVDDPSQFGVFEIDKDGNLVGIVEKPINPPSNLINTGIYALTKEFFDYELVLISETEFGLPQTLVKMAKDFPVKIIKTDSWQPVGNPEDLERAEKFIEVI